MRESLAALGLALGLGVVACGSLERASHDDVLALIARSDSAIQRYRETHSASDLRAAAQGYRRAVQLDPESTDALIGLARTDGIEHAFESSIVWAERALAIDPHEARAHGVIGDAALELGDLDRAERHYQVMIDRQPGLSSYARGARLLDRLGRHMEAAALMRLAIAAGGTSNEHLAWCHAALARMLGRAGELDAAGTALAAANSAVPDHPDLGRTRALLESAAGGLRAAPPEAVAHGYAH